MNTNAETDALVCGKVSVRFGEGSLRLKRALNRLDRTPELGEHAVASRIDDAAPVVRNKLVEDFTPFGEPSERADLVGVHEAAVSSDVG